MSRIRFIQAGGTIDKNYLPTDISHGYNFTIGRPAFHSTLQRVGILYGLGFSYVCKEDSLDMSDDDRKAIKAEASSCTQDKVIITHDIHTIHVTAKYLADIEGKVIVLTGAMRPECFRDSDADFNLGMAVAAVQWLPEGVYIALRGEVKRWDEYSQDH